MKASRYNFWASAPQGTFILFNGLSGGMLELSPTERDRAEALLEAPPSQIDLANPVEGALADAGMLVSQDTDEVRAAIGSPRRGNDGVLELTLVPTYRCNFRCTYCYVEFRPDRMAPWVEDAICRYVMRRLPDYERLLVNWFGGEPLLERTTVLHLTDRLARIAERARVPQTFMVATNGYLLTPETVRRLVEHGIHHLHVTIDGPATFHDRTRPLRNGAPTFDVLLGNVCAALVNHEELRLTLRMNALEETVHSFTNVLDSIPAAHRHRVQVNATEVRGDGIRPTLALREALNAVNRRAIELGYDYYDGIIGVGRGVFCHADRTGHLQVGPDGSVYTCSPATDKPEVQTGRLTPEGARNPNERHSIWLAAPHVHEQCVECPYLCFCHGGCVLDRVRGRPSESCKERYAAIAGLVLNRYLAAIHGRI